MSVRIEGIRDFRCRFSTDARTAMKLFLLLLICLFTTVLGCTTALEEHCGPELDGMSIDDAKALLEPETTTWIWADTNATYDNDYVDFYAHLDVIDDMEFSEPPVCACTILDDEVVDDCQLFDNTEDAYEYRQERG